MREARFNRYGQNSSDRVDVTRTSDVHVALGIRHLKCGVDPRFIELTAMNAHVSNQRVPTGLRVERLQTAPAGGRRFEVEAKRRRADVDAGFEIVQNRRSAALTKRFSGQIAGRLVVWMACRAVTRIKRE